MNLTPLFRLSAVALALLSVEASHAAPSLEERVAALETLTAGHSSQLAKVFVAQAESTQATLPRNDYLRLASLNVPAGRYMYSGQVFGWSADGQPKNQGIG